MKHHATHTHGKNIFFVRGPDPHQWVGILGTSRNPFLAVIELGNAVLADNVNTVFPKGPQIE